MDKEIKREQLKLDREANVNKVVSESLNLVIGESKEFTVKDVQAHQMVRTRLYRIRQNYGKDYRTKIEGNKITVTRFEDEVVN